MSFVKKIVKSRASFLCLIVATAVDRKNAWYFISVKPNKFNAFNNEVFDGPSVLSDYGDIIESGYGEYPSQEVITRMREEYGFQG
jgi:hypothetical protein